jgi:hypothetical protein
LTLAKDEYLDKIVKEFVFIHLQRPSKKWATR